MPLKTLHKILCKTITTHDCPQCTPSVRCHAFTIASEISLLYHQRPRTNLTKCESESQSLSCVRLFVTPKTVAHHASLSMGILQARYGNTLIKEFVFFFLRSEAVWQLLLKRQNTERDGNFQHLWRKNRGQTPEVKSQFQVRSNVIHNIYLLFQTLIHNRLSQNFEYSSLCYIVGPCC